MTANGISYNFKPFWNRENVNWCSSLFKTGDMDSDSNLNLQYNTLFLYKKKITPNSFEVIHLLYHHLNCKNNIQSR
jgi:hypothetical protein